MRKVSSSIIKKEQVKGAVKSFGKFIHNIAYHKNGKSVLKPIDAIKKYYEDNKLDYDYYYDFETLDRVLWINAAFLCISKITNHKEVYLDYFGDNIKLKSLEPIYKDQMNGYTDKEKLILLRNSFCHNHYDITDSCGIRIKRDSRYGSIKLNFTIKELYSLIMDLDTNLFYLRFTPWIDKDKVQNYKVNSSDDALDYCIILLEKNSDEVQNEEVTYIKKLIQLNAHEFKEGLVSKIENETSQNIINDKILDYLNKYMERVYKDLVVFQNMYDSLFVFVDTMRFFIIFCRQNMLEYDYHMLQDNYTRFYFLTTRIDQYPASTYMQMYEPNVGEEYENMMSTDFKYVEDPRNRTIQKIKLYDELMLSAKYYLVFIFLPLLQENSLYFPYDKLEIMDEFKNKDEEDIKRHLRNSSQHHNFMIKDDEIHIFDYNQRSMKKTFSAVLKYNDFFNAVESAYFHIPFEMPFYRFS
ncbi:hypothetical protein BHU72_13200 [Desulfuribacillus stibiiarsenatis]|uniref:Uncharacterized protein n=1 Tax=Desulfuribacillus stibiiarsenatis TaxID=1390249 RepID=A0A1E5L990_9FIRM|nr:hypothetical protein [Desulfuribacillus stibiiarsenatis]OEH86559.1 hypothetical protein BHU72_13200 [Desulfuribacillus stibiiarsenatis]